MHTALDATVQSTFPSLADIRRAALRLQGSILKTPLWQWQTGAVIESLFPGSEIWLKLELFQKAGSFKLRGAMNCIDAMDSEARGRGVVAASAGNHAIAVAYAARAARTHAQVLMSAKASAARISLCRELGAQVILTADIQEAFERALDIEARDGRTLIPAFDGPKIAEGTATIGLELMNELGTLDAVIVPIGGGGLAGGIAAAVKQISPLCKVYGVEPTGANLMHKSFLSGRPEKMVGMSSIADSLGAPHALPYSYALCKRFIDQVVQVSDDELRMAVYHLFREMKLAVEPAAAASTAALFGPLREKLQGQRVALIVCGTNLEVERFAEHALLGSRLSVATG